MEYAGRQRGAKGLFGWMTKLPYTESDKYLFAYLISGLIIFIFGGLTGLVNGSYSLDNVVHNTAWLPGHFHMTLAGPVFLGILGMSTYLYSTLSGKKVFLPKVNVLIPYIWMIGLFMFSTGLMWGGLIGEPRRTNLGMTYLNPQEEALDKNGNKAVHYIPSFKFVNQDKKIITDDNWKGKIVGQIFSLRIAFPFVQR